MATGSLAEGPAVNDGRQPNNSVHDGQEGESISATVVKAYREAGPASGPPEVVTWNAEVSTTGRT